MLRGRGNHRLEQSASVEGKHRRRLSGSHAGTAKLARCPRVWDVCYAVAQAYARGEPLRRILYSAHSAYHSGKYFVSSNTGDGNTERRLLLEVW
jgi:hypothetical protein